MSHIFAGDEKSIDPEVIEAVKGLPNNYWVLAGFTVGREVDFLVIRTARPNEHSAIIITELKRYEHAIRGISQDAVWERQDISGQWHPIDGNYSDRNPYWQAVNGANQLKHWLWNNQRLYLSNSGHLERDEDQFGAWPLVLILSPTGIQHLLPLRPTSRYGAWVFELDRWLSMLQSWNPRKGVGLTAANMQSLVKSLGLTEIHNGGDEEPSDLELTPPTEVPAVFMEWLRGLPSKQDFELLKTEVNQLRTQLEELRDQSQPNIEIDQQSRGSRVPVPS